MTATLKIVAAALALLGADAPRLDARQIGCIAEAVYHEARGEPEVGQLAVAHVVLTRAARGGASLKGPPITPCAVILEPGQFRWAVLRPPVLDEAVLRRVIDVVITAVTDPYSNPLHGATDFYAPAVECPSWSFVYAEAGIIGGHRFMFRDG